jgi:hypothetical protein
LYVPTSQVVHRLQTQLEQGWEEKITWTDSEGIAHHDTVFQASLLAQLQAETVEPRATTSSENKNANKAGSKAPGNTEALHLHEECVTALKEARSTLQRATGLNTPSLGAQVAHLEAYVLDSCSATTEEQILNDIRSDLSSKVRSARIVLGYDMPKVALPDTPCDRCGGVLIVAKDASSDVVCVGPEGAASCGKRYRRKEWVSLLEKITSRISTEAACTYTGRSVPTLYRWAAEGRVGRRVDPRTGRSTWDPSELPRAVPGQPPPLAPSLPTARTPADTAEQG